jgi:hypothetical protein
MAQHRVAAGRAIGPYTPALVGGRHTKRAHINNAMEEPLVPSERTPTLAGEALSVVRYFSGKGACPHNPVRRAIVPRRGRAD